MLRSTSASRSWWLACCASAERRARWPSATTAASRPDRARPITSTAVGRCDGAGAGHGGEAGFARASAHQNTADRARGGAGERGEPARAAGLGAPRSSHAAAAMAAPASLAAGVRRGKPPRRPAQPRRTAPRSRRRRGRRAEGDEHHGRVTEQLGRRRVDVAVVEQDRGRAQADRSRLERRRRPGRQPGRPTRASQRTASAADRRWAPEPAATASRIQAPPSVRGAAWGAGEIQWSGAETPRAAVKPAARRPATAITRSARGRAAESRRRIQAAWRGGQAGGGPQEGGAGPGTGRRRGGRQRQRPRSCSTNCSACDRLDRAGAGPRRRRTGRRRAPPASSGPIVARTSGSLEAGEPHGDDSHDLGGGGKLVVPFAPPPAPASASVAWRPWRSGRRRDSDGSVWSGLGEAGKGSGQRCRERFMATAGRRTRAHPRD